MVAFHFCTATCSTWPTHELEQLLADVPQHILSNHVTHAVLCSAHCSYHGFKPVVHGFSGNLGVAM